VKKRRMNEEQARQFGIELAKTLSPCVVIALIGDIGTGKTTLTRAIAEGLKISDIITSPTFTIIQEYRGGRLPLYHFDVYRLTSQLDLINLGYEEYFYADGVTVVEWADLVYDLIPSDAIVIRISFGEPPGTAERLYEISLGQTAQHDYSCY